MLDAFGVERDFVSKAWKGEPGDKRNTKYALAYGASPVLAGIPYTVYRQTKWGRDNRKESIAEAKKRKKKISKGAKGKPGDKRNTKYAASGIGAGMVGMRIGRYAGAKAAGTTVREAQQANTNAVMQSIFNDGSRKSQARAAKQMENSGFRQMARGGAVGRLAGIAAGGGAYYLYRQSDTGKKNRAESIAEKKKVINARFGD